MDEIDGARPMKIAIAILKVKLTTLTVWFIAATARPILTPLLYMRLNQNNRGLYNDIRITSKTWEHIENVLE